MVRWNNKPKNDIFYCFLFWCVCYERERERERESLWCRVRQVLVSSNKLLWLLDYLHWRPVTEYHCKLFVTTFSKGKGKGKRMFPIYQLFPASLRKPKVSSELVSYKELFTKLHALVINTSVNGLVPRKNLRNVIIWNISPNLLIFILCKSEMLDRIIEPHDALGAAQRFFLTCTVCRDRDRQYGIIFYHIKRK